MISSQVDDKVLHVLIDNINYSEFTIISARLYYTILSIIIIIALCGDCNTQTQKYTYAKQI